MEDFQLEFPIFVTALIANIALVAVVIQYGPKDKSRTYFSVFVLAQMFWITANYFAFRVRDNYFLTVSRLTMFFATFHAATFYLFIRHFLLKKSEEKGIKISPTIFSSILVSILTLTPVVFSSLTTTPTGSIAPKPGPLIPLFGIFVAFCISAGMYRMVKMYRDSAGIEKIQWKFLTFGLITTFVLVLAFSFLNFVLFENISSVRFGHLYTLPFVVFTSYAMIRHNLLNIKAVVAEVAVVLLNLILFLQFINSGSISQFVTSGFVLFGTLILGFLLIKSVHKEVEQRKKLEILTSQLQIANEKLKVLDKARAEFISIASHQLRTPPATVKWYLSAIIHGDYGRMDAKVKEMLTKTERTNNLLISLIEDILNVSRIERGKMEFLFEKVDLKELAQITYEQLQPLASEKKQQLTFVPPATKLPSIMADKEKLRQVMNNMIDNAIKYTPHGGTVSVSLAVDKGNIRFAVKDSGKGISQEDQNSIFEKFTRGKESIQQSAGLGLGLYVAKVIIEQHKGKIWAESPGEGKGSTFLFSLPIKNNLKETTLFDLTKDQQSQQPSDQIIHVP